VPNSRERGRSPDDRVGGPNNKLRVDLYRRLIPQLQAQDQHSGMQGYNLHWNDPDAQWNKLNDIRAQWNSIGLAPCIQTLFYVIETLEGEDLGILESMDALTDPLLCPEEVLPIIAASFGYRLKQELDVATKRLVVQGLFHAYKCLGQRIGFDVFYRMVGFRVIRVYPLWKKDINEDQNRYNRTRYVKLDVVAEPVGPSGSASYNTILSETPIVPGSLRIMDGTVVLKDEPSGYLQEGIFFGVSAPIVGPGVESGSVNYQTGEVTVNFSGPTAGVVTADYAQVADEYPYRAARMDIEILMNPGGVPIPLVDSEVLRSVLDRLDEVRPIHVLLRALTLAFEVIDSVSPGPHDRTACTSILVDSRDPVTGPGLEGRYLLSSYEETGQDDLRVAHASGGTVTEEVVVEDRIDGFVCPGTDLLDVDAGPYSQQV
jgi:hypothetical protein